MSNFYIAFAVYLNLIFIAAKLWDQIQWSWGWIMMPITVLTFVGMIAMMGQSATKKRSNNNIVRNIQAIKDLIETSKARRDTKSGSKH